MFDKNRFKHLIELCIGEDFISDFATACGVNRTYLSKLVNMKLEKPPSPDIIRKISLKAKNNVTYEQLMTAAGHINNNTDIHDDMLKNVILSKKNEKDIEKIFNKTIEYIESQEGLMLDGKTIDETDKALLKETIELGLKYAKANSKKHSERS